MSSLRWVISALLLWHLTALTIAAVPTPADPLPPVAPSRHVADDPIAGVVAPILDSVMNVFAPVPRILFRLTLPVRPLVNLYIRTLHLPQYWAMFANPPGAAQYLRVRYYVGPKPEPGLPAQATWAATEIVLPTNREDQVRTFQSFRDSSRDKALVVALDDFHRKIDQSVDRTGAVPQQLPDDLAPVGRYFARRFAGAHLAPGEQVVRTEVWYGEAPIAARGKTLESSQLESRFAALREYYAGPVRMPASVAMQRRYGAVEKEADIIWMLRYYEDQ